MAIAVKQSKQILVTGEDSTITASFDAAVTAGSALVLIGTTVTGGAGASFITVNVSSVSGGGTWSTPTNVRGPGSYDPNVFVAYALNVSAGSPTVTITVNQSAYVLMSAVLLEVEGAALSSAIDKEITGTGPTSGNTTTLAPSGGLSQAANLAVLCVGGYFGTPANPSGWTSQLSQQNGTDGGRIGSQVSTLITSSTTGITGEVTANGSGATSALLLVMKEAAVSGPKYRFDLRSDTFTSADTNLEVFVWRNGSPHTVLAERYTGQAGDATAGILRVSSGLPVGVTTGDTIVGLVRVTGGTGDTSGIISGTVEA
jgi:hypothetical protein